MSPTLSQESHQGLQHDDPETWLNIKEDLVGAGVDTASVGSEHELIKRFLDNIWAGGDIDDDNLRTQSEELEEDGSDDNSDGQTGKPNGDAASAQGSKGKIDNLQEAKSRLPAPKTRSADYSNPSMIDFQSKDVVRDLEHQNLGDRVLDDMEHFRSRRLSPYKEVEALLLCWDQSCSDMATEMEVEGLKAVFETRFGYNTTVEHLNAQSKKRPQAQLNSKVAMYVENHDDPDTLLIIYYAGHGALGDDGDLYLQGLASILSNGFLLLSCYRALKDNTKSRKDKVNWKIAEKLLETAEADVLEIFDW